MRKSNVWLRGLSLMILSASLHGPSRAQETQPSNLQTLMPGLNLMPVPANVQMGSGSLKIDAGFTVAITGHTDARLTRRGGAICRAAGETNRASDADEAGERDESYVGGAR